MAVDLTALVDWDGDIDQLADFLSHIVGKRLVKSKNAERDLYHTEVMSVLLDVFDNEGFVNDQGIEFERFPYFIDFHGLSKMTPNPYYDEWARLTALLIAGAISQQAGCECVVVDNMQTLVEVFPATAIDKEIMGQSGEEGGGAVR